MTDEHEPFQILVSTQRTFWTSLHPFSLSTNRANLSQNTPPQHHSTMDQNPDVAKLLAEKVGGELSMPGTTGRRDKHIPEFIEEMAIFSLLFRMGGNTELAQCKTNLRRCVPRNSQADDIVAMVDVAATYEKTTAGAKAWQEAQDIIYRRQAA